MSAAEVQDAPSLRQGLSRFMLLLALTWIVGATLVLGLSLRHEVNEVLDDGLIATSEALARVWQLQPLAGRAAVEESPLAAAEPDDRPFAWQLLDAQGRLLERSAQAPAQALVAALTGLNPAGSLIVSENSLSGWRVRARALDGGRWLLVGQKSNERLETLLEVAGSTITVALLIGLVGIFWLHRRLRREMRPLSELHQVLAGYDPLQTEAQLPPPALRELAPVHAAVQELGQRLAASVSAERAFSAHAAHALRTPLAGLEAQLAVAQREAPQSLQPRLARMRGATERLGHVVSALLAMFRTGGSLTLAPVDLEALLARVSLGGLEIEFERPLGRPLADSDLLEAALMNLLDNAARYGAHRVRIAALSTQITLTDDGPGVSAERLDQLRRALEQETGELGADDRASTGLGLALADRVARAHRGRLELLQLESGFAVRLQLAPASAAHGAASRA